MMLVIVWKNAANELIVKRREAEERKVAPRRQGEAKVDAAQFTNE